MKIKNKHTGQVIGATYHYWKTKILNHHKEINYDILSQPDIVDVYKINPQDGKLKFIESTDRRIAKDRYLTNDHYTIKDADMSKYDEYYRKKDIVYESFLKRLFSRIKQIIKPKKNPNQIPFSRSESIQIKTGVWAIIISIVLFAIDKIFF